jgi:hypothetical protein
MHSRSLAKSAHRRQVLVSGLTAAMLLVGCRQDSQPPASPIEVARQIVTARANRDTATIVSLTTPSQQTALQDLLLAVDEFRVQAIRLRSAVAIHIGGGISKACDLTHLTDHLALFSEQVELLDETITADRATVAFMLAGRLPTKRAEFTREAGQWRYDPGDLSSMQFAPRLPRTRHRSEPCQRRRRSGNLRSKIHTGKPRTPAERTPPPTRTRVKVNAEARE